MCAGGSSPTRCSASRPRCGTTSTRACSAADELPRPVAVRPAALPGHHRPVRDPPVRRLRPAVPGHQHPPGHGRRPACCCTCTGRSAWSSRATAVPIVLAVDALREGATSWSRGGCRTSRATWPPASRRPRSAIRVVKSFGRSRLRLRAVRRGRPPAARHIDGQGPAVGAVLDLPRGDPQPRGGRRAAARRARRRSRRAHPRRAGRLRHADALAGLAGRVARRDPGDGAGGDDRRPTGSSRSSTPSPTSSTGDAQRSSSPRGHLRFEHVGFAYPGAPTSRCCATSTSTSPGRDASPLVGATGSGKTTLTALVPRLYDVTAGRSPSTASTSAT